MGKKIDFVVIKTVKDGMFITDNIEGKSYWSTSINSLLFDDQHLVATPKDHWYRIDALPKSVKKKGSTQYNNRRWELKEGYPESELTPKVLAYDELDSDDDIYALYVSKYDTVEGVWEEIEFDVEILSEEESFYIEKPKYKGTPSLMTQLTTNPLLHAQRECSLSGKEFYNVIRNYIKTFIDGRYAKITSDYDFCLTVEKVIHLTEPVPYTVGGGTKKTDNHY